jgi:hypothetical protein
MAKQFVLENDLESEHIEHYSKLDKVEFDQFKMTLPVGVALVD